MVMIKEKPCKGTGKAKGYGCNNSLRHSERNGIKTYEAKYGLCPTCQYEWATSNDDGKAWFSKELQLNKKKEFRKKKNDLNTSGAMKLADMYFSRYIRLKNSVDGKCTCYTCGSINDIKECDNGHYMKREHKATRYHENNCRVQDKKCNGDTKHNGKQIEFRECLVNEVGEEEVLRVERLSKTTIKANTKFYRDIADHYREKVKELQRELKVKYW